jgi:hypothetical protein
LGPDQVLRDEKRLRFRRVIDCDIHVQIGDCEEALAYVEPAR